MTPHRLGLFFCMAFVSLEACQAVYLGAVFQALDSFVVGAWVFGLSVIGSVAVTAWRRPRELAAAGRSLRLVLVLNLTAALTWCTYFLAIQLIEPAVVFTIFCGMVPLGTRLAAAFGMREARAPTLVWLQVGEATILVALLGLAAATLMGLSGFVRGGFVVALAGVLLAAVSGGVTAAVILLSVRLSARGVGPLAQFGLRFVLYATLACVAALAGIDDKGTEVSGWQITKAVLVGLAVIAFPLYLVQKAVALISATTIAAVTALGPALVFGLQILEGRVAYAPATLAGLALYIAGALIAVAAATRETQRTERP